MRRFILLILTCTSLLPWDVFVDKAFVPYFALCLGGPLAFIAMWVSQIRHGIFYISISVLIAITWIVYVLLHWFFLDGESYYCEALLSSIIVFVISAFSFQKGIIKTETLYWLLTSIAAVEVSAVCLQASGLVEPLSHLFKMTGTFENPNLSAMMTALCIPAMVEELRICREKPTVSVFLIALILLSIVSIVLLRCRTAIIMVACAAMCYTAKYWKGYANRVIIGCIMLVSVGFATVLYSWKPQSADGRLFIWRNAVEMIAKQPQTGFGFGLFEKEYNLFQADILESLPEDAPQRKLAKTHQFRENRRLIGKGTKSQK